MRRTKGDNLKITRTVQWLNERGAIVAICVIALAALFPVTQRLAFGEERAATPTNIEGPFFKPNSPKRALLRENGMKGTKIVVTGRVLSEKGASIAGAKLDFWQADADGEYDLDGYRLRGHQFSDKEGRYSLETIVPGEYPGRPPHIHVKVQAPNEKVLTTQLYFPNVAGNRPDPFFKPALMMKVEDTKDGKLGRFDFVLRVK